MNWLRVEDLLLIHEKVIEETGGLQGVHNWGALEAALKRPFTSFGDEELFHGLWFKVAALIHGIVMYHPFLDGNKRTALVAADVCLRLNGWRLVPSDEVEPFFWSVAGGEKTIEEIAKWLETHSEKWNG